jgi:hypothetical protein
MKQRKNNCLKKRDSRKRNWRENEKKKKKRKMKSNNPINNKTKAILMAVKMMVKNQLRQSMIFFINKMTSKRFLKFRRKMYFLISLM